MPNTAAPAAALARLHDEMRCRIHDGLGPVGLRVGPADAPVRLVVLPETGRHLRQQAAVAEEVARAVAVGHQVLVVTFSDTVVQGVNVLLALGGMTDGPVRSALCARLGLPVEARLDPALAEGYGVADGAIVPLKRTEDGFVPLDMNQAIAALTERVLAIQDARDA